MMDKEAFKYRGVKIHGIRNPYKITGKPEGSVPEKNARTLW